MNYGNWIFIDGVTDAPIVKGFLSNAEKEAGYEIVPFPEPIFDSFGDQATNYLGEVCELLMSRLTKKVVFVGSHYSEFMLPLPLQRASALSEEDMEVIEDIISSQDATKIFFLTPDTEFFLFAKKKDPLLSPTDFINSVDLLKKYCNKSGFITKWKEIEKIEVAKMETPKPEAVEDKEVVRIDGNTASVLTVDSSTTVFNPHPEKPALDEASSRLELAKVIQSALLNGIIHGQSYYAKLLDQEVREFLKQRLNTLMGLGTDSGTFNKEEVDILKQLAKTAKQRLSK